MRSTAIPRRPDPAALVRIPLLVALATTLTSTGRVRADSYSPDRFEIEVYDSETAPPGTTGIELHVNSALVGSKGVSASGELPSNQVVHLTFEPHLGVTDYLELGLYLQVALRPDGLFDYGGVKQRVKLRLPRRVAGFGFAINFEISEVPTTYEANGLGSEIRPVIDFRWRRLYASVNPIVGIDLAGPLAGKPQFEPAAKLSVTAFRNFDLGLEYYGALGPLNSESGIAPLGNQTQRLFAVIDASFAIAGVPFNINAGGGYGFAGDDRWIAKAILGVGH